MGDMDIRIENSFELPSEEDWKYLDDYNINAIRIDIKAFSCFEHEMFLYPRIHECVWGFNNKIGSLCIMYALCHHYYDLGIPDEPWYVSPSLDGKKSIQYMPHFQTEHYMRRFWFNHFAANLYVTAFGIWDSIIELLNIVYDINAPADIRQRNEVLKWLRTNQPEIASLLNTIIKDNPIYAKANAYRTQFVHGMPPSDISKQHCYKKDTTARIIDSDATLKSGEAVYKVIPHATTMSIGVGHYTPVKQVLETFDQFTALTASTKDRLIDLIVSETK